VTHRNSRLFFATGGTFSKLSRWRSRWVVAPAILLVAATLIPSVSGAMSGEPSGDAPPTSSYLPGYSLSYETTFPGTSLPSGWAAFQGAAAGDPGSQWSPSNVTVGGGLLQLNATQNNGQWVTGGVSSSRALTYGAIFVNSRVTGAGPTQVEMLYPVSGWPPEVDFDETYGGTTYSMATDHYGGSANLQIHDTYDVDMTQWHTWGIIWTPSSISYTIDGTVWATVAGSGEVPDQPMTLNIQQQTYCGASSPYACPTSNASTQVDWVAEFTANSGTSSPPVTTTTAPAPPITTPTSPPAPITTTTTTQPSAPASNVTKKRVVLRPFERDSTVLSSLEMEQVRTLAREVVQGSDRSVTLSGACASIATSDLAAIARTRALAVKRYLLSELTQVGGRGVAVTLANSSRVAKLSGGASSALQGCARRVVAIIS